jgi:2-polyprenyl-3-methyl-5-hydroxy-6-metoxy-1,4-benzoquinol methylase
MIEHCVVDSRHGVPVSAFTKRGFQIYVCPGCGCIMGDLDFVPEQYEHEDYYTIASRNKEDVELEWGFRWRYILRRLSSILPEPRILDVGAGNGYFVSLARQEFHFDADGLEISDTAISYARTMFGLELLKGDLHGLPREYNAVCSFNVIEHVTDPKELLQGMRERLVDGGYLFLSTPNPSCIHRRLLGLKKWNMVDPPHHINLFPREALAAMLRNAGFDVQGYETLSTYIRFVRRFDTRGLLLRRVVFNALKAANLGADHFFVCCKRPMPTLAEQNGRRAPPWGIRETLKRH